MKDSQIIPMYWPDFVPPPEYESPHPEWDDPRLPDFRLIFKIARENGYSIGLHGSMRRDCDLIAVPWVEDAKSPDDLIDALCAALDAVVIGHSEHKPHGRKAWSLQIDGWFKVIDISITARVL